MNERNHIQMPAGCSSAAAPRFALGTERWVAKRALLGRRTD